MNKKILGLALITILFGMFGSASAQSYPTKAVKIVVPQAPGGATDVFARHMADKLGALWRQPVVVENRAGAAGIIGTDVVAKAEPDGYTLLLTYAGSQAVNQSLYSKLPFDSVKDFSTVATIATTPFLLVVGEDSSIKDFPSLIARAKAAPGRLTYSTSGNGSINHLLSESLNVEAGIQMMHVPYKAIAAALLDVSSGTVDNAFSAVPSAIPLVNGGKLRPIAVSSAKRNASFPDVPAIAEMGYPNFDVSPWWGILAPANTPQLVVEKINADVAKVLQTEASREFFRHQGAESLITTSAQFHDMLESDVVKWAKVVNASGAKVD